MDSESTAVRKDIVLPQERKGKLSENNSDTIVVVGGENTASFVVDRVGDAAGSVLKKTTLNNSTIKATADFLGKDAKAVLKTTKVAGEAIGAAGSAFDAGMAIYKYSQGGSAKDAAKKVICSTIDVGISSVPVAGTVVGFIGSENIWNEQEERSEIENKALKQGLDGVKEGDASKIARGAAAVASKVVSAVTMTDMLGAAERKVYDIAKEWMPETAENIHKFYRIASNAQKGGELTEEDLAWLEATEKKLKMLIIQYVKL